MPKLKCKFCKCPFIIKRGKSKRKKGSKQRYKCLVCGRRFVKGNRTQKIKGKFGGLVILLWQQGLSLREIKANLAVLGVKVHHETIRQQILNNKTDFK